MQLNHYIDDAMSMHHSLDKVPDMSGVPMHVHDSCEIFHFISGNGYYTVEGNNYKLEPGSIMLMRNSEAHKLHIETDTPYERFVVHFSPESIFGEKSDVYEFIHSRPLGVGNKLTCSGASLAYITLCFDRMSRAISSGASREEIHSFFRPVLYELMRTNQSTPDEAPEANSAAESLVSEIILYINNNLTELKGMEFIEQNFYFSRSYLNRIFKKATGSTIWDYVIVKRLMKARNLILSGKPALAASMECGFADYSSFYRQYKKKFGVSPSGSI